MRILTACLIVFLTPGLGLAQDQHTEITLGSKIDGTLGPGDRHVYRYHVEREGRFSGSVDQKSLDVVVEIVAPNGQLLSEFDDSSEGPEPFSFMALSTGTYSIAVYPFDDGDPGDYEVSLDSKEEINWVGLEPDGIATASVEPGTSTMVKLELGRFEIASGQVDQSELDVRVQVYSAGQSEPEEFDNRNAGYERFVVRPDSIGTSYLRIVGVSSSRSGSVRLSVNRKTEDPEFFDKTGVASFSPTQVQVHNLALLARVWGFLKYHHPQVTTGQVNWDAELLRIIPSVVEAKDVDSGIEVVTSWALDLEAPQHCAPCAISPDDLHLSAPVGWIQDDEMLGRELSTFLLNVRMNRYSNDGQYYVEHFGNGVPYFRHEAGYPELTDPSLGYRLLGLFRYWNFIQYWFPYRDLVDGTWGNRLEEYIPRFAEADSGQKYGAAVQLLAASVKDGHINVWRGENFERFMPFDGSCRLPLHARWIENQVVVYHVLQEVGVEIGDVILSVDNREIGDLFTELSPYFSASNRAARLRWMVPRILNGECGPIELELLRSGKNVQVELDRIPLSFQESSEGRLLDRQGEAFQRLSEDIAYLKLSSVERAEVPRYLRDAEGSKGLIIDIRNYPSEFMPFALGSHLVSDSTEFARFTQGSTTDPGAFSFSESLVIPPTEPFYDGQVVVLVNEDSQSQSEYTAMAFQARKDAVVIGSTTAGADGNVSRFPLPGGIMTTFSGIGVFYPDKTPTQRVGIIPNVFVEPSIEGVRNGRDEVLEAAIKFILGSDAVDEEITELARRY